jgi:adenylate cyclase
MPLSPLSEAGNLIDRAAAKAVGSRVPLVELDPRTLKGFDQPVPVFAAVVQKAV